MSAHTIKITNGHITFVYDDAIADLLTEGDASVTRVSHVEPVFGGGWSADMSPVGGPVLLASGPVPNPCRVEDVADRKPFATRAEALAAERAWLTKERGL